MTLLYESNTVLLTQRVECRSFESKLCDSERFTPDTISLLLSLFLILIKLIKLASSNLDKGLWLSSEQLCRELACHNGELFWSSFFFFALPLQEKGLIILKQHESMRSKQMLANALCERYFHTHMDERASKHTVMSVMSLCRTSQNGAPVLSSKLWMDWIAAQIQRYTVFFFTGRQMWINIHESSGIDGLVMVYVIVCGLILAF